MRLGQKNGLVRQWARTGTRPRQPKDQRYQSAYLFGAVRTVAAGAHSVLLMDLAGWHTTGELKFPDNLTPVLLPPRSPELNPTENVWQYLRQTYLSNRVFDSYDAIIDAACDAWNQLIDKPWKIMSIGMREWAHSGQTQ